MSNEQIENDSPDLEALFDSIAQAKSPDAVTVEETTAAPVLAEAHSLMESEAGDDMYSKLGHLTRKLHDTLRELGFDKQIAKAADSIPDARDRLSYVAAMTEQAAERALNATEKAMPLQDKLETEATQLTEQWEKLFEKQVDMDGFKELVNSTRGYLKEIPNQTRETNAQLMEIMMAQDFQDLTGQVIKKVLDLVQQVEQWLVQALLESSPPDKRLDINAGLMNGPVVNPNGRSDVVTNQQQVDDLLESLGF